LTIRDHVHADIELRIDQNLDLVRELVRIWSSPRHSLPA